MDEQTWREYVKRYEGKLVVWIDQTTDPFLNAQNSAGVCSAMALDFVTAYQTGQPYTMKFVNDIWIATLTSGHKSRIPPRYLKIQDTIRMLNNEFRATLKNLENDLKYAEENDQPEKAAKIKEFKTNALFAKFPGMKSQEYFTEDNIAIAGIDILRRMRESETNNGPAYFYVQMNGTKGHAVAFGFRKDLSMGEKFPAIYEFFDANLGLFMFNSSTNLMRFLTDLVWENLYGQFDYSKFQIITFPAKKGVR